MTKEFGKLYVHTLPAEDDLNVYNEDIVTVVLCTQKHFRTESYTFSGVVVSQSISSHSYKVGYYSDEWHSGIFKEFKGKVELS